jgi:hypothetical protein
MITQALKSRELSNVVIVCSLSLATSLLNILIRQTYYVDFVPQKRNAQSPK